MLSTIASYWLVSLPAVVTGLLLLRLFKQAHESMQSRKRVGAAISKRK